jgi:multidrug efflux pump subunit AcrB
MVRLPRDQRQSEYDLERLMIRTPTGQSAPLGQVARLERGRAPTDIKRENGARVVNVTAELATGVKSSTDVVSDLVDRVFPEMAERHPGLTIELVGERREQGDTLSSLGQNGLLALFVMYALLAVPFKSYVQPVIVMMGAIPMGVVGALWGHILMGYTWSIISVFGVVALAGVVVNDSLVLIDGTNRARRTGLSPKEAVILGSKRRLRPILLTSLTTFFGLAPMIVETSVQAQFLIPMAISLGFGVLFATFVILLLVPALYLAVEDAIAAAQWGMNTAFPDGDSPEEAADEPLPAPGK